MALPRDASDVPPLYSRRPIVDEQVLAITPDFPLAVNAIQVVQEWFPGTSAGDAWEFIQQLAHLVWANVRSRRNESTSERTAEDDLQTVVPEDSPMPDTA